MLAHPQDLIPATVYNICIYVIMLSYVNWVYGYVWMDSQNSGFCYMNYDQIIAKEHVDGHNASSDYLYCGFVYVEYF